MAKQTIPPEVILAGRIEIYKAVIKTASAGSLQKAEVIPIAENIWKRIIEPLTEVSGQYAEKPATTTVGKL